MAINDNDFFSVEWVVAKETALSWGISMNVECYGALLQPESGDIVLALCELKSRAGMNLRYGGIYLPFERWQQAVIIGLQAMQNFIIHILTNSLGLDSDEAVDLMIGLTESLEAGCIIRPSDPRHN